METVMDDKDWDKVYEIKEEYYILHSTLIKDCLKRCDNEAQRAQLLLIIAETNSPYSIKSNEE